MIQQSFENRRPAWSRWLILPLFCAGGSLFAFTPAPRPATRVLTVVIDAGHGGADPGAVGGNLREKDINLEIALAVQRLAPGYPVHVLLSRPVDSFVTVQDRVRFTAQEKADLFVSIHVNQGLPTETGIQNLVSVGNAFADSSALLGTLLARNLGQVYPTENVLRHAEHHINVLDRNVCPAVLLECGYISNPKDRGFMRTPADQDKIARGILESLLEYAQGLRTNTLEVQTGGK